MLNRSGHPRDLLAERPEPLSSGDDVVEVESPVSPVPSSAPADYRKPAGEPSRCGAPHNQLHLCARGGQRDSLSGRPGPGRSRLSGERRVRCRAHRTAAARRAPGALSRTRRGSARGCSCSSRGLGATRRLRGGPPGGSALGRRLGRAALGRGIRVPLFARAASSALGCAPAGCVLRLRHLMAPHFSFHPSFNAYPSIQPGKRGLEALRMKPRDCLRGKVTARNRRQRMQARKLRMRSERNRNAMRRRAQWKIERSRTRIRNQAEGSARRAERAKAKAARAGERAPEQARSARRRAQRIDHERRG
jgi:hypothetical protein